MAADDFFSRWSQRKSQAEQRDFNEPRPAQTADGSTASAEVPTSSEPLPPPTIDDVAHLTPDSDFSRFVRNDVDDAVKRSALKKLFSNPHFNVMDGLDIYIDDYNKFTPMTPALLASLNHAKDLLNPPGVKKPGSAESEIVAASPETMAQQDPKDEDIVEQPEQAAQTHQAESEGAAAEEAKATSQKAGTTDTPIASERAAKPVPDMNDNETSSPQGGS